MAKKKSTDKNLDEAKKAVDKIFGDTTVRKETTLEQLEDLRTYIDEKTEAIEADIKAADDDDDEDDSETE